MIGIVFFVTSDSKQHVSVNKMWLKYTTIDLASLKDKLHFAFGFCFPLITHTNSHRHCKLSFVFIEAGILDYLERAPKVSW